MSVVIQIWEGYDEVRAERVDAEFVATHTEEFLQKDHSSDAKPFFLSLGTKDVHRPHGQEYDPGSLANIELPPYLPDEEIAYLDMAVFFRRIEQADRQMGRIFAVLRTEWARRQYLAHLHH